MANIKLGKPFKGNYRVSQLFGNEAEMYTHIGLLGHNGIDFACPTGTEITSCLDGWVEFVGEDSAAGKGIYIISDFNGKKVRMIYWHLMTFKVNVGDSVRAGDVIGISDNTGMSTGAHLHLGYKPVYLVGKFYQDINHGNGYNGAEDCFNFLPEADIGVYKLSTPMATGIFVKKIQELLNLNGAKLVEDGKFGKNTSQAVIKFQTENGLKIDGVVGSKTINKLLSKI